MIVKSVRSVSFEQAYRKQQPKVKNWKPTPRTLEHYNPSEVLSFLTVAAVVAAKLSCISWK